MESPGGELVQNNVVLSEEIKAEGGAIQGQIKLYNVNDEERIESDSKKFLSRTLSTAGLQKSLRSLRDSLNGEENRGTHLLYGPFGTGKSHQMVVLYQCFNSPEIAGDRFDGEIRNFCEALPEEAKAVTVSLQHYQPERIWDPFFEKLDYEIGSFESGGFPDIKKIEEAVGDKNIAFFVDELERWYRTLDDDRKDAAKGFLQSLLEASSNNDNIYVFLSVLREESDINEILNREQMIEVNMREEVDITDLIHHRLFEGEVSPPDEIISKYLEAYEESDHVDVENDLRSEMLESYPFHPKLLESLRDAYYGGENKQAARGMLYLLSKVVVEKKSKTDLITHSDIEPDHEEHGSIAGELSKINPSVHDVALDDISKIKSLNTDYGENILKTLLVFSLRSGRVEDVGAELGDVILGTYETEGSISGIKRDLERISGGKAPHLHNRGRKYAIREERTTKALISDERSNVKKEDALSQISEAVKDIFSGGYPVTSPEDLIEIPDKEDLKVVINTKKWNEDTIEKTIKKDGKGREWRNTLAFVQPIGGENLRNTDNIEKGKDILAAQKVSNDHSLDEGVREDAEQEIERQKKELRDRLEARYGEIIDGKNLLDNFEAAEAMRIDSLDIDLNVDDIKEWITSDEYGLKKSINEIVVNLLHRKDSISVNDIYEEFRRNPKYPVPGNPGAVREVLENIDDDSILFFEEERGFSDEIIDRENIHLVNEDSVDHMGTKDIKKELRQKLEASSKVEFNKFKDEIKRRKDKRLEGDIEAAASQLRTEEDCEFIRDSERVDKPTDSTIIKNAEVIDSDEFEERLEEKIKESGETSPRKVIRKLEEKEVLEDREDTVDQAVEQMLSSEYLARENRSLKKDVNDPSRSELVPTLSENDGEQVLDKIREIEDGEQFSVSDVSPDGKEEATRNFLKRHTGESDPRFTEEESGGFRIPGSSWEFKERFDDPEELRKSWAEKYEKYEDGELTEGRISFEMDISDELSEVLSAVETSSHMERVKIEFEPGEKAESFTKLLSRLPDNATQIDLKVNFEK